MAQLISKHELETNPQLKAAAWSKLNKDTASKAIAAPAIPPAPAPEQALPLPQAPQPTSQQEKQADKDVFFGAAPRHYLTHLPKHPRCDICNASKLKMNQARR